MLNRAKIGARLLIGFGVLMIIIAGLSGLSVYSAGDARSRLVDISSVSAAAQQSGAAASQVLASASSLSQNSEAPKAQVDAFLREVRAA